MPRDEVQLPVRAGVDEADVEESLQYLLDTAEEAARAIALVEEAEDGVKRARAAALLTSAEKSQDRREAEAWTSNAVQRAIDRRTAATTDRFRLMHMRRWHELRIEVWRSLNANNRQGRI